MSDRIEEIKDAPLEEQAALQRTLATAPARERIQERREDHRQRIAQLRARAEDAASQIPGAEEEERDAREGLEAATERARHWERERVRASARVQSAQARLQFLRREAREAGHEAEELEGRVV
jgi:chromosome segregation ATPase